MFLQEIENTLKGQYTKGMATAKGCQSYTCYVLVSFARLHPSPSLVQAGVGYHASLVREVFREAKKSFNQLCVSPCFLLCHCSLPLQH